MEDNPQQYDALHEYELFLSVQSNIVEEGLGDEHVQQKIRKSVQYLANKINRHIAENPGKGVVIITGGKSSILSQVVIERSMDMINVKPVVENLTDAQNRDLYLTHNKLGPNEKNPYDLISELSDNGKNMIFFVDDHSFAGNKASDLQSNVLFTTGFDITSVALFAPEDLDVVDFAVVVRDNETTDVIRALSRLVSDYKTLELYNQVNPKL